MRFKRRHKEALEYYGLSYLLDESIRVWVDEDNILHKPNGCSYSVETDANIEGELRHIKVGGINQSECRCLENIAECAAAFNAALCMTPLYVLLRAPVPSFDSFKKLEPLCTLVVKTDAALRSASSTFVIMEVWEDIFVKACEELRERNENIRQVIFARMDEPSSEYDVAVMLINSSAAARELKGLPPADHSDVSVSLLVSLNASRHVYALWHWLHLVREGADVKDRHRKTMKVVGGSLIKTRQRFNLPEKDDQLIADVKHVSSLILQLEAELAAAPKARSKTFLVASEAAFSDSVEEVLAEKYALQTGHSTRLLAIPGSALQTFANLYRPSGWTLMPEDEKVRETAIKMWDSDPAMLLYSPVNLVDVAETLLEK